MKNNSFIMVPFDLMTDERYSSLSPKAMLLWGILYSRYRLSLTNEQTFKDHKGIFVYYSVKNAAQHLHCQEKTVTAGFGELEAAGLITRKRQNMCKPAKIYLNIDLLHPDNEPDSIDRKKSARRDFGTMKTARKKDPEIAEEIG